jgi:hypothetical protein
VLFIGINSGCDFRYLTFFSHECSSLFLPQKVVAKLNTVNSSSCAGKRISIGNIQCKKKVEFQFSRYSTSIQFWVVNSEKVEYFFRVN